MTLTQLYYATAVFTHQHFGRAAEACHVTQPTLSMQIHKLEEELGLTLFDRDRHPVEATEAGKHILMQAQRVLEESRKIEDMVKEMRGSLQGDFRMAIIPTLAPSLIYRIIPRLKKELPDVRFHIMEMQTDQIIEAIKHREIDAALLATPLNERFIQEEVLFYEPFMAFVPHGHRLSEEAFILHSELQLGDILLLNEGHCFRNSVLKLCNDKLKDFEQSDKQIFLESGNFESLIRLSKLGYGMTLLPYLTAVDLPKEDQTSLKPLDHPIPTREVSLVFHNSHFRQRLIDKLAGAVRKAVPDRLLTEKHHPINPF